LPQKLTCDLLCSQIKQIEMSPVLLISFFIAIVIYVVLAISFLPYLRRLKAETQLIKEGVEAHALVLNFEHTGQSHDNQLQVRMQIKVKPYMGKNFFAETEGVISPEEFTGLRSGSYLKVRYNPFNLKEIRVIKNLTIGG